VAAATVINAAGSTSVPIVGYAHLRVDTVAVVLSASFSRTLAGGGKMRTWAWAVGRIAEHESYHLGKCMLLRNLLPERHAR
jgi:hypothetical protein